MHTVANKAQISSSTDSFINTLTNYQRKVKKFAFAGAAFRGLLDVRNVLLWDLLPLNKQVPYYGLPNDCMWLSPIDLASFCDIHST